MTPIKEITIERSFESPMDKVWRAWMECKKLKQWWGPDNVSIPACEIDLRVGGRIYIVMEAGEGMGSYKGTRWPMIGTFSAIEPETKLAYSAKAWTEGQNEATEINQESELWLAEANGQTKIKLRAAIIKTGLNADLALQGMEGGYNQQFDKLERFLAK